MRSIYLKHLKNTWKVAVSFVCLCKSIDVSLIYKLKAGELIVSNLAIPFFFPFVLCTFLSSAFERLSGNHMVSIIYPSLISYLQKGPYDINSLLVYCGVISN